jgi:hypothetical protein
LSANTFTAADDAFIFQLAMTKPVIWSSTPALTGARG